jgi:hypothetical protein
MPTRQPNERPRNRTSNNTAPAANGWPNNQPGNNAAPATMPTQQGNGWRAAGPATMPAGSRTNDRVTGPATGNNTTPAVEGSGDRTTRTRRPNAGPAANGRPKQPGRQQCRPSNLAGPTRRRMASCWTGNHVGPQQDERRATRPATTSPLARKRCNRAAGSAILPFRQLCRTGNNVHSARRAVGTSYRLIKAGRCAQQNSTDRRACATCD